MPPHSLPVEPVQLTDSGGGGDPQGTGNDRGPKAPLPEGAQDKSNTLFMSHSPAAMGDLFRQLQDAVMIGQKAAAAAG